MKRISSFLLVFLLLTISTVGWAACPEGQEENDRTGDCVPILGWSAGDTSKEMIEFVSSNPYSTFSLINNPTADNKVTIIAELRFPKNVQESKKIPAMVFVHGSGGPLPRHQKWLKLFREMGIASVYANHFKPRGVSETAGKQLRVTSTMLVADALHLLNALAKHPRIDPNRIGIMGGSKGGSVAWWVTWNPLREVIAKDKQFAASIPLYPACAYWEKKDFTNKPMLMMIGDKDNYTGVDQCVSSMKEIRSAGYSNMQIKLYKGAYHGFDSNKGIRRFSKGYNITKCKLVVRADGKVIEMNSGFGTDTPDTRKKMFAGCASKGVTLGGNHVMPQAMQDVREFLTKALLQSNSTAITEHSRLKDVSSTASSSTSTASSSNPNLVWCATAKWFRYTKNSSCRIDGGTSYSSEQQAKAEHQRLKGTATASGAEAPLSIEPLSVQTAPAYLVVDVQAFLKSNATLPELVVVMQQILALKAAIKREDHARIEDRHDQLVEIMAEIEGFTAFQQARAQQRQAGAAILKQGRALALELRQYLVEHMEADNIGQLLTTLAALEAALGQGDIETVQRLIDTVSTAINATATPSN